TATISPINANEGVWSVAGAVHHFREAAEPVEIAVLFRRAADEGYLDFGTITATPGPDDPPDADADADEASAVVTAFSAELRFPGPGSLVLQMPGDALPQDDA